MLGSWGGCKSPVTAELVSAGDEVEDDLLTPQAELEYADSSMWSSKAAQHHLNHKCTHYCRQLQQFSTAYLVQ